MGEAISIRKIPGIITKVKRQNKCIVLAGGCFDILHPGHVIFLDKAKRVGDILFVLLESDLKVKKLKGNNRPVHNQQMRAKVLSALRAVDYVIMLPFVTTEAEYDKIISKIKPDVIVASSKDEHITYHKRAARVVGSKFKLITNVIKDHSTSNILTVD